MDLSLEVFFFIIPKAYRKSGVMHASIYIHIIKFFYRTTLLKTTYSSPVNFTKGSASTSASVSMISIALAVLCW